MTDRTKSFLKHTILGLIGGGAVSALYSMNSRKDNSKSDQEFARNEIVVPLSKRNFLKAVRSKDKSAPKEDVQDLVPAEDVGSMSPKDLAALKKALLRKSAEECQSGKVKKVVTTTSATVPVRRVPGAGSTYPRDKKGRFVAENEHTYKKTAGVGSFLRNVIPGVDSTLSDAGEVIMDNAGMIGGLTTGLVAMKLVSDRIMINKKKRQVEEARKRYVDALDREVNDEDLPYYRKSADDHGIVGSALGYLGLAGIAASTTAGIVMYRIMENRRKENERAKDKDLNKYPAEKTIRFRFPDIKDAEAHGFFA